MIGFSLIGFELIEQCDSHATSSMLTTPVPYMKSSALAVY